MTYPRNNPRSAPVETQPEPEVPYASEDYVRGESCPECGKMLGDNVNNEKEAITHYGDEPIPANHLTLIARQRQAFLMGWEIPRR